MATERQIKALEKQLRDYKKKYLNKNTSGLDEASTRIMVNDFLIDVLGYVPFEEVKTEYRIKSSYADYVIQIDGDNHFVVEVKSISQQIKSSHLKQASDYAANEGIEWVLLTNGQTFALYKVKVDGRVSTKKVFEHDLKEGKTKDIANDFIYLLKRSVVKNELDHYWRRFLVLDPTVLSQVLYYKDVALAIRRVIRAKSKMRFSDEEILDALYEVISQAIEHDKPSRLREIKRPKKT